MIIEYGMRLAVYEYKELTIGLRMVGSLTYFHL